MELAKRVTYTASGNLSISRDQQSRRDYTALGMKGQVIVGTITGVAKKISIDFNGTEIQVPKNAVRDAKEGEKRSFEIKEVSKNSIVLKEVESALSATGGNNAMIRTMVGNDKANFSQLLEDSGMSQDSIVDDVSNKVKNVAARMTGQDAQEIEEEGMSLEKYDLERVDRMIARIREQRSQKREYMDRYVQGQEEQEEQIKKIVVHNAMSGLSNVTDAMIEDVLKKSYLPVTENAMTKIAATMEMASVAPDLTNQAMNYMLTQGLDATIGNVYHAQFAGSSRRFTAYTPGYGAGYQSSAVVYEGTAITGNSLSTEEAWGEIVPQVQRIIAEAGMEVDDEAMMQAKWLFRNDLPITADTLQGIRYLEQVKECFDPEELLTRVVDAFRKGDKLEDVCLLPQQMEEAAKSVESFLASISGELTKLDEDFDISMITKRRQLEEVRLKLTADVAGKMLEKGISLDVDHIEKVVEELRGIEDTYYKGLLKESGVAESKENVDILRNTQNAVRAISGAPSYLLGNTLAERWSLQLGELEKEAVSLEAKLLKAGEAYETLMTRPDRSYGDSIQKAFQNVTDILEDMELANTQANTRAVKILGYNQMPITEENIYRIKEYDAQVNKLLEDLHPAVTVELIKRNINPLESTITELDDKINEIKEELGVTGEEKYSKFLYQLEQRNGISPEDRKTYINIYKLLNNIQKMDGAAVGYVVQSKREMTLENLLTAVRTLKGGGVEAQVADHEDQKDIKYSRGTLLSQVNEAFHKEETPKQKYYEQVLQSLSEELSPSGLERLQTDTDGNKQNFTNLFEQDVEKLLEELKRANVKEVQENGKDVTYEDELLKEFRQVTEGSQEVIAFLTERELPITLGNIMAASQLDHTFDQLRDKAKKQEEKERLAIENVLGSMSDAIDDQDELYKNYEILEANAEEMLDTAFADSDISSMELRELRQLASSVSMLRQLAGREDYHVPMVEGEKITNIHLTILHGTSESGAVKISMELPELGKVEAEFRMEAGEIVGTIYGESRKAIDTMEAKQRNLEERLNSQGVDIGRVTYELQSKSRLTDKGLEGNTAKDVDTKVLYQVAKAFVKHASGIEEI